MMGQSFFFALKKREKRDVLILASIREYCKRKQIFINVNGISVDISPYLIYVYAQYRNTFIKSPRSQSLLIRSGHALFKNTFWKANQMFPDKSIPGTFKITVSAAFNKFLKDKTAAFL